MSGQGSLAVWWQKERSREFTRLECGLMGALFASIAIILIMVFRFQVS